MPVKEPLVDSDGNVLEDLGTLTWEQAVDLSPQPSGLTNRLPCPEMLEEDGHIIEIVDSRGKRHFNCVYNENYVSFCALKGLLRPLGVITPRGEVKKSFLTTVLLPKWIAYAEAETDRVMEKKLNEKAQMISEINGRSFDECLSFLKSGSFTPEKEKEKVTV